MLNAAWGRQTVLRCAILAMPLDASERKLQGQGQQNLREAIGLADAVGSLQADAEQSQVTAWAAQWDCLSTGTTVYHHPLPCCACFVCITACMGMVWFVIH